MKNELLIGLAVAVAAGCLIAVQSTYLSRSGAAIGEIRSGMLTTVTGSVFAVGVLLVMWRQGVGQWQWSAGTWLALIVAGVLGAVILAGISFASQRAGITSALASLLVGQMLISSIVDHFGWGGGEAVPFSWPRLAGIALLVAGVYLTLGRQG